MIEERLNQNYIGAIPSKLGDRYWGQDHCRDWWYQLDQIGLSNKDLLDSVPCILSNGWTNVVQGAGDTINVAKMHGLSKLAVEIPDSFASFPPTKKSRDVEAIRVEHPAAATNLPVTGGQVNDNLYANATLNGVTLNYVKIRFKELSYEIRTKAKSPADLWDYAVTTSYEIRIEPTAPTDYEIKLGSFIGIAAGSFTFTPDDYDIWMRIWHTQNMGAGSGLDADTLDGQHLSWAIDWPNTTNKPDPTITAAGSITGSVTLTDLTSQTFTMGVVNDSHTHNTQYYTKAETYTQAEVNSLITGATYGSWQLWHNGSSVQSITTGYYVDFYATGNGVEVSWTSNHRLTFWHTTGGGWNHIPAAGSAGQMLMWSAGGTAAWQNPSGAIFMLATANTGTTGTITVDNILLDGSATEWLYISAKTIRLAHATTGSFIVGSTDGDSFYFARGTGDDTMHLEFNGTTQDIFHYTNFIASPALTTIRYHADTFRFRNTSNNNVLVITSNNVTIHGNLRPNNTSRNFGNATNYWATVNLATGGLIYHSDRRSKIDIKELDLGMNFLRNVKPYTFRYRNDVNSVRLGYMGQDLVSLQKRYRLKNYMLGIYDDKEDVYSVSSEGLNVIHTKALQELDKRLSILERR